MSPIVTIRIRIYIEFISPPDYSKVTGIGEDLKRRKGLFDKFSRQVVSEPDILQPYVVTFGDKYFRVLIEIRPGII